MNDELLTVRDMARELGVSVGRVHQRVRWLRERNILVGRRVGNMYLFDDADVEIIRPGKTGRPPKYE